MGTLTSDLSEATRGRLSAFFSSFCSFFRIGVEELAARIGLEHGKARSSLWRMLNGIQPWNRAWVDRLVPLAGHELGVDPARLSAALLGDAELPPGICSELATFEHWPLIGPMTSTCADRLLVSLDVADRSVEWYGFVPPFLLTPEMRAAISAMVPPSARAASSPALFSQVLVDELHERLLLADDGDGSRRILASPESAWTDLFGSDASLHTLPASALIDTLTCVAIDMVTGNKCRLLLLRDDEFSRSGDLSPCAAHEWIAIHGRRLFKKRIGHAVLETTRLTPDAPSSAAIPYVASGDALERAAASARSRTLDTLITLIDPLSPAAAERVRLAATSDS